MAIRSRSRRTSQHRSPRSARRGILQVERLWGRLADLFGPRTDPSLATAVVLAPRRLEPRRLLDAGAAGLALDLLDSGAFVQTGQDYAALNDAAANSAVAAQAATESELPGEPQAAMPNAAPSNLMFSSIADVNEGGFATLSLTFKDADAADTHMVEVDWGDGSATQTFNLALGARSFSTTHQYADDSPTATTQDLTAISVRVLDNDGGEVTGQTGVVVHNVAPTAFVVTPPAILEDGFAGLLVVFNDPGTQDTHTVEVDWGDGSALELLPVTPGFQFFTATHQYLDDDPSVTPTDNYTIKVRVLDDDGGASLTQQVTAKVTNLPPSNVQIAPLASINENGTATLNLTFDDPGSEDTHQVEVNWGDGSATQLLNVTPGARNFTANHQYLDDNPTATSSDSYTITVRVLDDDSGASSPPTTATVTVNNVAPSGVVVTTPPPIFEDGVAALLVVFNDPGTADTHTVEIDWGDGSAIQMLPVTPGFHLLTATHQYLDDNPTGTASDNYTITVRVHDDDGGVSAPQQVTAKVTNLPPSNVQLAPVATVNENGTATLNLTFDDPGSQDTHQVEVNWGDGSATQVLAVAAGARTFTATHQYLDDNPTATASDVYTITVRVLDDDTGASSPAATTTVTVNNAAPSNVQLAPVASVNENGVATLNLTFDDPGTQDTHQVEVNWGDGSATQVLVVAAGARTFSATHQYLDDNPTATASDNYTITVRVLDDDGGASSPAATTTVTVNNVAPSNVQLAPVATINENGTGTLNLTFDDPGSQDTHQVEVNWGDGSATQVLNVAAGARTFTATHQYLDDNPTSTASDVYTITVRVLDDDTGASSPAATTTVTVNNVAPSNVQLAPVATINENGTATLNLTFDDPGSQDTHQVEVNWGDGSATQVLNVAAGARTFTATHQYLDDNPTATASDVYTITVRVLDDDSGASPASTTTVTVNNVAPSNVQLAPVASVNENGVATLNLTFDDPGSQDTHQVEVTWGDGSATQVLNVAAGARTFTATHQYLDDNPTATASDAYTITVRVLDDDGGASSPASTTTVTVNNVAPSNVQLAPVATINENGTATLNLTFDDPGTQDTHQVEVNWGDGSATQVLAVAAGARTITATHQYLDDNPTGTASDNYTITVRVLDDDAGASSPASTTTVTVNNVNPLNVAILPAVNTRNEGAPITLDVTFDDPGSQDTHTFLIEWGDGLTTTGAAAGHAFSGTHTYADNGVYTVKVTVTDDDGGTGVGTASVTVNNVAPTLTVASNKAVNEGQLLSITDIGAFTDPGFNNPANTQDPSNGGETSETFTYTINWGDGTAVDSGAATVDSLGSPGTPTAGSFDGSHTYADNGTYTVTVTVFDDDLGQVSKTFTVTVANVAPTLTVAPTQTINEGALLSITNVGAFTDPGFRNPLNTGDPSNGGETDETFTYTINWGDGTTVDSGAATVDTIGSPGTPTAGSFDGSHTYADNGTYTVTVTVFDDDLGQVTKTFTVTVNNVAPTLAVVPTQTINEGALLSITDIGAFTDPGFNNPANTQDPANGGETTETFTYTINWGDGTSIDSGAATVDQLGSVGTLTAGSLDGSHTYADNGTYTVTVTVFDDDLGQVAKTFTVIVNNVAPTLNVAATQTINEGQRLTITDVGTFTDPGFDNPANTQDPANDGETVETFTYTINWGDGTAVDSGAATVDQIGSVGTPTAGSLDGSHIYADNGVYTVTVTVFDDDLGQVSKTFTVNVNNVDPTLTGTSGLTVNEGDDFTLTELGVGVTDPGFDNPANAGNVANGGEVAETFTGMDVDWGDGTAIQSLAVTDRVSGMFGPTGQPSTPTTAKFTHPAHTYADNGTYTVKLRFQDDDGQVVTRTLTITVNNVAPTLGVTANKTVNENQLLSITDLGTFTDPGFNNPANTQDLANGGETAETFTYTINWGDGTTVDAGVPTVDTLGSPGTLTAGSLDGSHTYADNGTYTVTVTVFDDDLGQFTKTFTVTVNNVAPTLATFGPDGKKLQGTEITAEGKTNINFNWRDPGFDNASNQPNLANGAEFYETFTSLVDWGDGTVDAVHTYASAPTGPIMVSVNGAPAVPFAPGASANRVLTLVAGQTALNDPGAPETLYTFQVDWGDGTVDTFQLALKSPILPGAAGFPASGSNGQTIVVMADRDSGAVGVNTTASAQLQHTYLGPPDPLHPAADVPIRLALLDDDGGIDGGLRGMPFDDDAEIFVGNPGAQVINIRIDTSPKVPLLTFQVRTDSGLTTATTQIVADADDGGEIGGSAGESKVTSERSLVLVVINPDGTQGASYQLPPEVLVNLAGLFRNLPDNHYKIFLIQGDAQVPRLVIEVFVRDGRVIDPGDDSQGARDKPPTDETTTPNEEAAAIEGAIDAIDDAPAEDAPSLEDGAALPRPGSETTRLASELQSSPRSYAALRHGSTLASVALALSAAGRSWRTQVDESLAKAKSEQRKNLKAVGHWKTKRKPR